MTQHVWKIFDRIHQRYTVNQGRISRNNHHPGRVYSSLKDVESCLELCRDFFGDCQYKEVHQFTLADKEVMDI